MLIRIIGEYYKYTVNLKTSMKWISSYKNITSTLNQEGVTVLLLYLLKNPVLLILLLKTSGLRVLLAGSTQHVKNWIILFLNNLLQRIKREMEQSIISFYEASIA